MKSCLAALGLALAANALADNRCPPPPAQPTAAQQQATVAKIIDMLDKTPFVERYAIFNWVEDVRLGTVMALNILHGTTAGNRVGIACPKLQFSAEPTLADEEGTAMLSGSFAVMPNAGNEEMVLTFT